MVMFEEGWLKRGFFSVMDYLSGNDAEAKKTDEEERHLAELYGNPSEEDEKNDYTPDF